MPWRARGRHQSRRRRRLPCLTQLGLSRTNFRTPLPPMATQRADLTHAASSSTRSNSVSIRVPDPVETDVPVTFEQFSNTGQVPHSQIGVGFRLPGSDIGGPPVDYYPYNQMTQNMNIQGAVTNGPMNSFNGSFDLGSAQQPSQGLMPVFSLQTRWLNDAMNHPMSFGPPTFNTSNANSLGVQSNLASTQTEAAFHPTVSHGSYFGNFGAQSSPELMPLNQQVHPVGQSPTPRRDPRALTHGQAPPRGFYHPIFDAIHRQKISIKLTMEDKSQRITEAKGALDIENTFITRGGARRLGLEIRPIAIKKRKEYLTPFGRKMPCGYVKFEIEWTFAGEIYHTPSAVMVLDIVGEPTFIHLGRNLVEQACGRACGREWRNRHLTPRNIGRINTNARGRIELSRARHAAHKQVNSTVDPYSRASATSRLTTAAAGVDQHYPNNAQMPLTDMNTVSNQFLVPPNTVFESSNPSFSATQTFASPVSSAAFSAPLLSSAATAITAPSQMGGPSWANTRTSSDAGVPGPWIAEDFEHDGTITPRKLELS
ncbi:hypothetical protein F4779DRAFT_310465 [Xylariaceae sp. FL0662B]|nr:hypothetical protein F4779DRAFT_310465 [Xylariaceae sp. FL0662B]